VQGHPRTGPGGGARAHMSPTSWQHGPLIN